MVGGRFEDILAAECRGLPRIRLAIAGEPSRIASLIAGVFGDDVRLVTIVDGDAEADARWTFHADAGPAILVDELPHAELVERTLRVLPVASQLAFTSVQRASERAVRAAIETALATFEDVVAGIARLEHFADVVVLAQATLFARIALARGIRPDGARRELAKVLAGAVELGLAELPLVTDAEIARRVTAHAVTGFTLLCQESVSRPDPDASWVTARLLTLLARSAGPGPADDDAVLHN